MKDFKPCGACWNCGEPLPFGLLYCNNECRNEHEDDMARNERLENLGIDDGGLDHVDV